MRIHDPKYQYAKKSMILRRPKGRRLSNYRVFSRCSEMVFMETERLILRQVKPADAWIIYD